MTTTISPNPSPTITPNPNNPAGASAAHYRRPDWFTRTVGNPHPQADDAPRDQRVGLPHPRT